MPLIAFAAATLLPVALLAAGLALGGAFAFAALFYMALLVGLIDQLVARVPGDPAQTAEFPGADGLLVAVGACHLALMPLTVWAVCASDLATPARVALFAAAGLWMGQVAHPAAHELIHRGQRGLFRLGVAIYVTLLIGHHASAHRLVHHRHVATPDDPSTARGGEGFWRFALRAWVGSFRAGWRAERARGEVAAYPVYLGGAALSLGLGFGIGGWAGVAVWAGLALHAQVQLLLADYVQHYGLTRSRLEGGRYEPVDDRHSWNAPHWLSAALMLNAPRHSDHHAHPARAYPALRLPGADAAPRLPYALPLCCLLALWPPLWRRVMHPHLAAWRRGSA